MERFDEKKNFNISATQINDKIRVSTAAIYYENNWFGSYFQLETIVFIKGYKGSKMKIHNVPCNQYGIDYCKKFHEKVVGLIKIKLNNLQLR